MPLNLRLKVFYLHLLMKKNAPILLKPEERMVSDFKVTHSPQIHFVDPIETGRDKHLKLVATAVDEIASGKLNKVIVSRRISVGTQKDCFEIFKSALHHYTNSFCYLWFHPETGIWIGASPEVFLKVRAEEIETVSLAGTLKTDSNTEPIWGNKEMEEQQMVTDYIYSCFSEILDQVTISEPETIRAGNVWHLKSKITGKTRENFELGRLIKNLHPTPAVCGFPKQKALRFINANETYKRGYYTGFLGELNLDGCNTNLFVNLRCIKLEGKDAAVFVGGGITQNSVPELEWLETQHKSQTMLSLL